MGCADLLHAVLERIHPAPLVCGHIHEDAGGSVEVAVSLEIPVGLEIPAGQTRA